METTIETQSLHQLECKTPKNSLLIDTDKLLYKINILTTRSEHNSVNTKLPTIKDFGIIKPISRGAFGKVFLGYKNNDPNKLYAIKVMRKSDMINKNMVSQVITERNALALSRSPFCVHLFYSLQSVSYVYLVMEYMVGGDLKSLLAMYGYFDESAARFYAAEVALALQYLHEHGIVHRDIKPDNMLLSSTGHVKLTDFGLSKIETRRDLEISDLINCSPNLNARTPGQLLSLTSHLSFGSEKKYDFGTGNFHLTNIVNKQNFPVESSDSEADTSMNDGEKASVSKISGVSPFFSAEELNVSVTHTCSNMAVGDSSSSYHTCESGDLNKSTPHSKVAGTLNGVAVRKRVEFAPIKDASNDNIQCKGCKYEKREFEKENNYKKSLARVEMTEDSFEFSMLRRRSMDERIRNSKGAEDSGVSSRKSDYSNSNIHCEMTSCSIDKVESLCNSKDDFSSSDYSRSPYINNTNEISEIRMHSPFRNISRHFKRPAFLRGLREKTTIHSRFENSSGSESDKLGYGSTGITQEIDILDIGSSTPKKRKAKSPIRGVLKMRSLSDYEIPPNTHENLGNVVVSTPVSSQKLLRRDIGLLGKLKATRFAPLPSLSAAKKFEQIMEKSPGLQYLKLMEDDLVVSPINIAGNIVKTPKNAITPFRTPKSVRRGEGRPSSERVLGTPDYLAPELLNKQGHGPAVDWWSLGVCLYEFMTGIPPFNDETPQKVFDNILNKNIEWPQGDEALSVEAVEAVDLLLTMNPVERPAAKAVQQMGFFACIDWHNLQNTDPPFVPTPDCPTDTAYFEARNNLQHLILSDFTIED